MAEGAPTSLSPGISKSEKQTTCDAKETSSSQSPEVEGAGSAMVGYHSNIASAPLTQEQLRDIQCHRANVPPGGIIYFNSTQRMC